MTKPRKRKLLTQVATALADNLFSTTGVRYHPFDLEQQANVRRETEKVANALRQDDWKRAAMSGYAAKIRKARSGIGRNSTAGIPQWALDNYATSKL